MRHVVDVGQGTGNQNISLAFDWQDWILIDSSDLSIRLGSTGDSFFVLWLLLDEGVEVLELVLGLQNGEGRLHALVEKL